MASEKGPVATETFPVTATATAAQPPSLQPPAPSEAFSGGTNSLKRHRDTTPSSPGAVGSQARPDLSPSKIARLVDSSRYAAAAVLTGQAAREEEQRRKDEVARLHPPDAVSSNPAQQALAALRGAEAMSRANAAQPAAQPAVEASATKAVQPVVIPVTAAAGGENHAGMSPQSATSGHSLGSGPHVVHSPAPMEIDGRGDRPGYPQPDAQMEEKPGAMSYPGVLPPAVAGAGMAPPQRGMSLPMSSSQNPDLAPRSPSSKKHKCPYCETEFTRHHNLKSHLLTHSQEKPYVCQDCQMRFRRLHDLKRHNKLHTGEKPHICPKCDRKFARGDALARHNKGAGGCAGRRSSMGSFAGDDDYEGGSTEADDSVMTGVVYEGNEADMTEEDRRRLSLPSIKAPPVGAAEGYVPLSRTYPPVGPSPGTTGGLYPPSNVERTPSGSSSTSPNLPSSISSGHTPSTSISSVVMSAGSASLYSHGMTESPKPLSPAGLQPHQAGHDSAKAPQARSPSLASQLPQQQFGRRQSELPSPHSAASGRSTTMPPIAPQLPGAAGPHSRTSSGPSHAQSAGSGGSGDSSANLFSSGEGLWAYIQTLEARLQHQDEKMRQQDEQLRQQAERIAALEATRQGHETQIAYLTSGVNTLRSQVSALPQEAPAAQEQQPPSKA